MRFHSKFNLVDYFWGCSLLIIFFQINLLGVLKVSQKRDDFQWALHQMGGFNAILFLYGRVGANTIS